MSLKFRNNTNLTLWLAIAHEEQECTGSKWRKEGWWKLTPGQQATVWTGLTNNRNFYFYAHDASYSYEWKGNYYTGLPDHIFSRCWDEPGGTIYGMRVWTATADDYTINLVLEDTYQPAWC